MDKGILITADNKICIKDFERPLYESVGAAVGGCIELVRCAAFPSPIKNAVMIVCDDGLLKNLRLNMAGSCMYGTPFHGSPIVGDIVIMKMGYTDDNPDVVGLTNEESINYYDAFVKTFRYLKENSK